MKIYMKVKPKHNSNMIRTLIIMTINNNNSKDKNIMIIINKIISNNLTKNNKNSIKNSIKINKIMQKRFENFILIFENLN